MLPKCCTFWPKQQISLKIVPFPTVRHAWRKPFACCFLCGQISEAMTVYLLEYYFQQNEISDWKKSFKSSTEMWKHLTQNILCSLRVFPDLAVSERLSLNPSSLAPAVKFWLWRIRSQNWAAKCHKKVWDGITSQTCSNSNANFSFLLILTYWFKKRQVQLFEVLWEFGKTSQFVLTSHHSDNRKFKFLELEIRQFSFFWENEQSLSPPRISNAKIPQKTDPALRGKLFEILTVQFRNFLE